MESLLSTEVLQYLIPFLLLVSFYLFRKPISRKVFSLDKMGEKILAEKKTAEARIGSIVEAISPLLDQFPVDIRKEGTSLAYIGRPVDFVHFDPDAGITFIEVKSGNSKLSPEQKKLRALIREGKVSWAQLRVNPK